MATLLNITETSNGDSAYTSTESALLDFFGGVCRKDKKLDEQMAARIAELMPLCWAEDPLLTLRLLFYKRDCREGAGERRIFELGMEWILANHAEHALANVQYLPEYGSFKDVAKLLANPVSRDTAAMVFAHQLRHDSASDVALSLAAKWAPSVHSAANRAHGAARSVARAMGHRHNWQKWYRGMLCRLRHRLSVTEHQMSLGEWDSIDYGRVPSLAMQRYRKAFERRDPNRWGRYKNELRMGDAKVNSRQLMPHEILRGDLRDELTHEQWRAMVDSVRKRGTFSRAVAICDVSGSMQGLPMDVSVALGIMVSEISDSCRDLLISFTEQPRFFDLKGLSLEDKVYAVKREVGYNTDLRVAFEQIISRAKTLELTDDQMPDKIILISDMQFDLANPGYNETAYQSVLSMYRNAKYTMPHVIFWNVQGMSTAFPVTRSEIGVCMVSGFSQNLLNSVLRGNITNPHDVMMQTLNSDRYSQIKLAVSE